MSERDEELSELRDQVARLRAELSDLRAILRCAGDIIVTADLDGRITEFSDGAERLLGYGRAEMLGRPAASIYVDPRERERLLEELRATGGPLVDREILLRRKDGRVLATSISFAELRDESGRLVGTVGVGKDITERKRLERELKRLSVTDKLTGLFNQSHFFKLLEVEKERAVRLKLPLSLLLSDLDNFKRLNDERGHEEGNRALRAVARVLFEQVRREVDVAFRYGGDEFCVLLPGTTASGALAFAERIRAGIEALAFGGLTASIGIAQYEPDNPSQAIVGAADAAMYRAKRLGGNRIAIFGRDDVIWAGGLPLPPLEAPKADAP